MPRRKDVAWNLPDALTWEHVPMAILMDIRDELKHLNRTLDCQNFQDMPHVMKAVRANTSSIKRLLTEKAK